eukprot:2633216-Pyramimonas_sp.AAC.1
MAPAGALPAAGAVLSSAISLGATFAGRSAATWHFAATLAPPPEASLLLAASWQSSSNPPSARARARGRREDAVKRKGISALAAGGWLESLTSVVHSPFGLVSAHKVETVVA